MIMNRRAFSAAMVVGTAASLVSTRGMAANPGPTKARNVVLDRIYPSRSVHARARPPPEPRSGFRRRRRFLFYEFGLGANDGDVGGAGIRYGVDVTTPRSAHPPP
jgi:hypothetical protein